MYHAHEPLDSLRAGRRERGGAPPLLARTAWWVVALSRRTHTAPSRTHGAAHRPTRADPDGRDAVQPLTLSRTRRQGEEVEPMEQVPYMEVLERFTNFNISLGTKRSRDAHGR